MAEEVEARSVLQRGAVEQRTEAMLNPWLQSITGSTSEAASFLAGCPATTCLSGVDQHPFPFNTSLYSHKNNPYLQDHNLYYQAQNSPHYPASEVFQPRPLHQTSFVPGDQQPVFPNSGGSYGGMFHTGPSFSATDMTFSHHDQIVPEAPAVGKSHSMRALYEENAALRRALHSIRLTQDLALHQQAGVCTVKSPTRSQQRYLVNDTAEGRTLSMSERGRWGVHVTPDWALQSIPLRPCSYHHCVAAAGAAAWEHSRCCWCNCYSGLYNEEQELIPCAPVRPRVKTLNEQMQAARRQKGELEGPRAGRRRRSSGCASLKGEEDAESSDSQQCAMCGTVLVQEQGQLGCGGLPLVLCSGCHPCADVGSPEATRVAPASAPCGRHRAAVAISLACKPGSASSNKKKPRARIVDLCRHLVGLGTSSATRS